VNVFFDANLIIAFKCVGHPRVYGFVRERRMALENTVHDVRAKSRNRIPVGTGCSLGVKE